MNPVAEAECRAACRRQAELDTICEGCTLNAAHNPLTDCADCPVPAEYAETEKVIAKHERRSRK